ncbi:hypothetical protein HYP06_gp072 [Vibrio phage vB_VspP_pVa5]|uniref:Uncharacterized protein n=1 Tax=Vibrio phage vB_VspP_pVa5 TaxID=1913109 RepID=A0A1J0GV93_9CAUD|nr:hypothetical protein HYP06_gp072 [Vibrio phage vB_VspP_pVa5]APC46103.1 hypothetical protein vBVspPpVa5_0101 [Vibrio phage vB_VspP_pVa5]
MALLSVAPQSITPEYYAELQDLFSSYFSGSGMSRELDCNYDEQEFDYISEALGTTNWDVMNENNLLSSFNKRQH